MGVPTTKIRYKNRIGLVLVSLMLLFVAGNSLHLTKADLPGEATGIYAGFDFAAAADPDTAGTLGSLFGGAQNDGRIMADKSVRYGADSFGVLSGYTSGMFGVTLSALSQGYYLENEGGRGAADVVFVLDFSSSMFQSRVDDGTGRQIRRAEAMVNALNSAINTLKASGGDIRIGIVAYSGANGYGNSSLADATVLLGLDRYALPAGQTRYLIYQESYNQATVSTVSGLTRQPSNTPVQVISKTVTGGTYTQAGVRVGADLLMDAADTAKRVPALVLLSDGDPTYGTTSFDNVGVSNLGFEMNDPQTMAQMGYWTIRTLVHQKARIGTHYPDASALVYTLGPGVTEIFGQTVLNPTAENLAVCAAAGQNTKERRLYNYIYGYNPNLAYADYADISIAGQLQAQDIEDAFENIVTDIKTMRRPLESAENLPELSKPLRFTDTLGASMRLHGAPAVRYGGTLYHPAGTQQTESGGVVTTEYLYSAQVTEASTGAVNNLSEMKVLLAEASDGTQTLKWEIPANLVPMFCQNEEEEYIGVPPVSLVYQVRPADGVGQGTYYTNNWTGAKTSCAFVPTGSNPYYFDEDGAYIAENLQTAKSENVTGTLQKSFAMSFASGTVTATLGNNGVIELTGTSYTVEKRWNDSGSAIRPTSVQVRLYANGDAYGPPVTLTGPGWSHQFTGLPKYIGGIPAVYSAREVSVPDGYEANYEDCGNTTVITNTRFGQLVIKKTTTGDIPAGSLFTFYITGRNAAGDIIFQSNAVLKSGESIAFTIPDGTYKVTELQNDGYKLLSVKLRGQAVPITDYGTTFETGTSSQTEIEFNNKYEPPWYFHKEHRVQNIFE